MPPKLPIEIILNVLDQLVRGPYGEQPIFDPSHPVTKTLRAFSLTSRSMYPVASRYLYRHCLYISDCVRYACFRRTLGLDLGYDHPQSLAYGQNARLDSLWDKAEIHRHITSIFISPLGMSVVGTENNRYTPMARLPQIIELCSTIGVMLKRLILDTQPVYTPRSDMDIVSLTQRGTKMFLGMSNLEELVASYDVLDYFHVPPPNLRKLTITIQELHEVALRFCFSISTLHTLVLLRPPELSAADIDNLFAAYKGHSLDVILVDVNSNHRTPTDTRDWTENDKVKLWEADVPTSFYGDDDALVLCDNWIWTHAVKGTLWTQKHRRMASWSEIQRRLAGPVHHIIS